MTFRLQNIKSTELTIIRERVSHHIMVMAIDRAVYQFLAFLGESCVGVLLPDAKRARALLQEFIE
jgi:hypothetical protein